MEIDKKEYERLKKIEKQREGQYKRQNEYIAKAYDRVSVVLPVGTVDKIKSLSGQSVNAYINMLVFADLESLEEMGEVITGKKETLPERPEEPRKETHAESTNGTLEVAEKPQESRPSVSIADLQAAVDRKRKEQQEHKEKQEQERKNRLEKEREQKRLEMRRYVESIRNRAKENQEQKEIVKQFMDDPFLRENVLKPERREDVVEVVGQETYDAIIRADKELRREETKQRERMLELEVDQGEVPDFMNGL